MLTATAVLVTAVSDHRTTEGQVGVLTRADVDLTSHVDALVGRVVEETGVIQVVFMGESSSLISAGT